MDMTIERTRQAGAPRTAALPDITRRDRARFVKEARALRAAEIDRLFRAIGRGLASLARRPGRPVPQDHPGVDLPWGARPL